MSRVISFRLNEKNARELQAIGILKSWVDRGFTIRHAIVEGLIISDQGIKKVNTVDFEKIDVTLTKLIELIETGQFKMKPPSVQAQAELRSEFINSIRRSAKPGIRSG